VPVKPVSPITRFWPKVRIDAWEGCWIWTALKSRDGYGLFSSGPRVEGSVRAHRFAYSFFVGPIPDGSLICHKCDVRVCVNPDHLFVGTPRDNMLDKIQKGRANAPRGTRASTNKLTEDQARSVLSSVEAAKPLAARLGVSQGTIYDIRNRRNWAWLT
jgi:hypothetical protein